MKTDMFLSLKVIPGVTLRTVLSVTASVVVAAAFAVPPDAYAATADNTATPVHHHHRLLRKTRIERKEALAKKPRATVAARSHRVEKRVLAAAPHEEARKRRVSYRMYVHHREVVRHVAFEPRAPQPFGLRESPYGLALRSNVALVVDQNTGETLFDKNSHEIVPIASISKLMTAMVVLDSKAPLDQMITVTNDDRDFVKNTGSRLSVGSVLSRRDMLHIALMASENRAAAALSRYFPGGRPAFIAAMNAKARQLGMLDTHFISPSGLTSENVSTARDLVKLVDAAYQYPLIREFSTDNHSYEVFPGRRPLEYNSTNALVHNPSWDIGLQKTGFINESGECLVMQATIKGRPVVMVLLDSIGKYSRFADASRVRTWLDNGGDERITSADASGAGT
jgi:D-alanyl-D-alanine endopeptidase (penicillin-binding protein 7)